jgi:hypothetical protein
VGTLAPWVLRVRTEDNNPGFWENFEWLARTMVRIHPAVAFDQQSFDRSLAQRITLNEADLRDLEAMRGVTVAPPVPTGHWTAKRPGAIATADAPTSR